LHIPFQYAALSLADFAVRSPLVSWTWSVLGEYSFPETLTEFRPSDEETVREMMAGRYLFASKLVDSQGISPFSIQPANDAWWRELHGFSWLRHFQDLTSEADKRFARTLVLDWIGRESDVTGPSWAPAMTAVRVMNWLRHLPVLTGEANADQKKTILRSLGTQLQSLKLRGMLAADPLDALFASIALLGATLCEQNTGKVVASRIAQLKSLLDAQIDEDGLHLSRNAAVQFELLTELVSVRQALGQRHRGLTVAIGEIIDRMHKALGTMILGNGEPAYFNGCGQLPVDLIIGLQSQSTSARSGTTNLSGYGVLVNGPAKVIADSGRVPPTPYAKQAHAGGLSFEFSHGSDLLVCNCGPAPSDLVSDRVLFRLGAAHSGPTVGGRSAGRIAARGFAKGSLVSSSDQPNIFMDTEDCSVEMTNFGYGDSMGVNLRRNLTLISDGNTLVGQDTILPLRNMGSGSVVLRFHLAPGAVATRQSAEDIISIRLKSGAEWVFLWEGGEADIDESVRQSAYFGFYRTQQIVIEAELGANREISWIFTRQNG
jgi:uncharacterized heparinase superfamily protein